mmetsp:Transcript_34851/g.99494  ORF Transcript_34851/g.99494 Transcript_34851/m.99494 type:complete len:274 (+) Transcript_34851:2-823(+)
MERQSWEAFLRNGRRDGGEEPPASALLEARALSGADMPGVERSPSRVETEQGLLLVEKEAVTWSAGAAAATYARWGCESAASVLERLKAYREEAENTKFVVWMGCAVHALMDGHPAWISDRADMMSQLFSEVRGLFEDKVTLIWSTPNYIDMDLMQAYPVKYDLNFYRRHKLDDEFMHLGPRDAAVAASNQVPVAPRAAVTSQYRGLQCNGLQHDAHGAQAPEEPDFVCPGFPVIEDLVLQGGLAAACAPERAPGVCSSSLPSPEQELEEQAP